ncbi:DUF4334 domain-containing protein [Planococcus shenhongbingii]|uniref:DUF4334 domain-containing protein n=1 Tax=Planococcus shenhongbingii TaxID=3058398 RepID=A0ABT8NB19_9BACL|nr:MULTISPECIES: DUF4334 domain-containing protein [unclassified Planococcus (in: firmicutes)]MDN7245082.1 DUF4334 domain-containing protein [Planococcus sp. N017]WKA58177.1 DUF4334 domain-containing protein [Planococcus sp. N016]
MKAAAEFWMIKERGETDTHTACRIFDELPPVGLEELLGTWEGSEFRTGHPLDGVLKKLNWYGKAFHDAENVDPLLFRGLNGDIFAVDPVPIMDLRKLIKAEGGKARMRQVAHRGKASAAMVYDNLPIIDHFRKVDNQVLMGMMDRKGDKEPYFFVLEKVETVSEA